LKSKSRLKGLERFVSYLKKITDSGTNLRTNRLMFSMETAALHCKNNTKHKYTFREQNVSFLC